MSLIARLGVVLGLNIEEFVKGTDEATKKTREYEYQLRRQIRQTEQAMTDAFNKMSIASAAFAAVLVNTFRQADEISDIAKGFDTSIEGLLATQAALQGAGGNAEDVATMFQKLAIAQDNAKEGSDEVRASFERLGIVGSKVDSLKLGDLFREVEQHWLVLKMRELAQHLHKICLAKRLRALIGQILLANIKSLKTRL